MEKNFDSYPKVLLITPPFTQLNTPYPATCSLKGFLNTQNIVSHQVDLSLEVILALFSSENLQKIVDEHTYGSENSDHQIRLFIQQKDDYIQTIDAVIRFLQGKDPTLAYRISEGGFLPKGYRYSQLQDLDWSFGNMGIYDKAKHIATVYLEEIGDFFTQCIDPHFGFSRYAEKLGRSANSFDELLNELNRGNKLVNNILIQKLKHAVGDFQPTLVAITIPFPGNLFSALKCGQWLKKHHPGIKVVLGGGFANAELRSLTDARVFNYTDFICLDDGELPLLKIIELLDGKCKQEDLKRTFLCENNKVIYYNSNKTSDFHQKELGTPDYEGLKLEEYLSTIEIANPMHRLWGDGRWNKLTLAHGCYWAKCSFCDTSLDYIKRYQPNTPKDVCNRIENLIKQTGYSGFHFVDEAAPPALLREVALELLRRKIALSWWTNIRFEKNFTADLCRLLASSGCIAVSGGLEVASARILKLINKGITLEQVVQVTDHFTSAGIMVHAYLMYGFPSQTKQETIDSLEVVRQLFEEGLIQSGFWHHFAMTAHSPVGKDPEKYKTQLLNKKPGAFANNDLLYKDLNGCKHEKFAEGLRVSLHNYMNGVGFDLQLNEWFDFDVPKTTLKSNFVKSILERKHNR